MARDSLAGLRASLAHRATRRILLFGWLLPACAVAPEALAAPYATHIGQPARVAGFLLMGIPIGSVVADILAARLLSTWWQRRIIVPAALLSFAFWGVAGQYVPLAVVIPAAGVAGASAVVALRPRSGDALA